MKRFVLHLGILTALAFSVFLVVLYGGAGKAHAPVVITVPDITAEPAATDVEAIPAPLPPATIPEKINSRKKTNPPPVVSSAPAPTVAPSPKTALPPEVNQTALDDSSSLLRGALVNIICGAPAGSTLHSISGSGVIVDPKGIILTNAHIGQYFLLGDRSVSCVIRSGGPATSRYKAELIFISPAWLRAHSDSLSQTLPRGTGEDDFALLAIDKSTTADALPSSFPFVPLATNPAVAGTPVVIASYGAQFLESSQVASNLSPTVVFGSVKDVFTFGTNTIDVLALGGSAAAQEGSSGGGVVDSSGDLVGIITTSTVTGATDTRSLDAITASYIRTEYVNKTGQSLDFLLSESTAISISDFAPQISDLESIITANCISSETFETPQ